MLASSIIESANISWIRMKKLHYIASSYMLKECILLKWMIEVERVHVFKSVNSVEKFNHILVYLTNSNDVLVGELTKIVQKVVYLTSSEDLKQLGVQHVLLLNVDHLGSISYKIELSNKKRYVIRKFYNLEEFKYLPSGLSTAYINCRSGIECLGFMGVVKHSENQLSYNFLSVQEKPSFYLSVENDFVIFKDNMIQAFYFILYILKLVTLLNVYRIELIYFPMFAVYNIDNNKWRFILETTSELIWRKKECFFSNYGYINRTIISISYVFEEHAISAFFRNLGSTADELKDSNNKHCFSILTVMVENELKNLKDKLKPTSILYNQCAIQ